MEPILIQQANLDGGRPQKATCTDQRARDDLSCAVPRTGESTPLIDIGRALDLLATAITQAAHGGPQGLARRALSLAQVGDDLEERDHGVRQLYERGTLRGRLTLGALAVLDAAERSQDRGYAYADALDYATSAAERFLDLLPDTVFDAANGGKIITARAEIDGAS